MMSARKARIVITGAGGFAGKNLAEYFACHGYTVHAMRRQDADLLDAHSVAKYLSGIDFDIVLHCAVTGGTRKTAYDVKASDVVDSNLRMFLNVEHCLNQRQRLIQFGSGAEYDRAHYQPKMPEVYFGQYIPAEAYGFSKYAISQVIQSRPEITCLRIFGLYGKYEDYRYKFISNAIVKNLLKLPIVISQNGLFDYLFIDDFVEIVAHFVECRPGGQFFNMTPTQSIDLIKVAEMINEVGDFNSEIQVLHEGMNVEYSGDNSQLVKELGGYQFCSYKEGISRLYQYYKSVFDTLDVEAVRQDSYLQYCRPKVFEVKR